MAATKRGKRTITKTVVESPADDLLDDELPDGAPTSEEDDILADLRSKFGTDGWKIKVYKQEGAHKAFCYSTTEAFDEEFTREEYGGGAYTLKVFIADIHRDTIEVHIAEKKGSSKAAPAESGGSSAEIRALRDTVSLLKDLVLAKSNQPQQPMAEVVAAVQAVHNMSGNGSNGGSDFDRFLKMMEVAKDIFGGAGSDFKVELLRTVKDVASPLLSQVGTALAQKALQGGTMPQQPQPGSEPVTSIDDFIRTGITRLKQFVVQGMDAGLVIDWITANAQNPEYQPFIEVVLRTEFPEFQKLDADLSNEPYLSWFRGVHEGLREAYQSALPAADDRAGATGNGSNAAAHGNGSKNGQPKIKAVQ